MPIASMVDENVSVYLDSVDTLGFCRLVIILLI